MQFSKEQIAHVMNGDVLKYAFDSLESKWTKIMVRPETPADEAELLRQQIIALGSVKTALKAMHNKQKETR